MDRYWPPDSYDRSDPSDDPDVVLHPAIVTLLIVAALVAAFVLGYFMVPWPVPSFSGLGG